MVLSLKLIPKGTGVYWSRAFKFNLLLIFVFGLSFSGIGLAQTTEDHDDSKLLLKKLEAIETFQANFSQRLVPDLGPSENVLQGKIAFTRQPQRFSWTVTQPFEQYVVLEDDELMVYEPDLKQVSYSSLDKNFQLPIAKLIIEQDETVLADYEVSYLESESGSGSRFTLIPIQTNAMFKHVRLFFDKHRLEAIEVKDSFANVTEFNFSAIEINEPIEDDVFVVDIPSDTEVLRLNSDEDETNQ